VPPTLRTEVKREIKKGRCEGFYLKRKDFVFGKWLTHGETGRVKLLRLAKKKAGRWTRKVDEVWEIKGKTATLKNPLEHFPHPTVSEFLKSINFYSSLNARQLYEEKKRTCLWDWGKPLAKFIQNFVFRLGFLDGMPGFLVALFMSLHSFLVRGKLYLLYQNRPQVK